MVLHSDLAAQKTTKSTALVLQRLRSTPANPIPFALEVGAELEGQNSWDEVMAGE